MKITTFNPQIITNDTEKLVKLFEELGFEKRHQKEAIGENNVVGIRMKDANGFCLDISDPKIDLPQDIASGFYAEDAMHKMYIGEIIGMYM